MKNVGDIKVKKRLFILWFLLLIFATFYFADGYYVRMVYETSKSGIFMRSEEVYEMDDIKVVIVNMPQNFVWVRIRDKWYIGDSNVLKRTFPIKDLLEIAYDYVKSKRLDISRDGVYKFNEDFFTIEIFVINREIIRVTRTVGDVTTTMYIIKLPKQFDIKLIISKYKFIEESPIPERLFAIFKLFLWSNTVEGKDFLRITGYDKDGKPLELEINKKEGDYKMGTYYLKILKASESSLKEIKNALRDY